MKFFPLSALVLVLSTGVGVSLAQAAALPKDSVSADKLGINQALVPHKALYDINLVATRSGSQVINISGKMFYEWKPSCDAWITDHRFNLFYEYADSPGMQVTSDFSTFETYDGESFNFSARRKRDNTLYQELRGRGVIADKGGVASFTMPEDLKFDLPSGAMFPMGHTAQMVSHALDNKKFFRATVFDGSDDEGPVDINTFIGKPVNALQKIKATEAIDMTLLNTTAWDVRMAVFPTLKDEESADYEMSVIFHENGIISDMLIEYDNFSVTQKLVALEKVEGQKCPKPRPEKTSEPLKPQVSKEKPPLGAAKK